MYSCIFIWVANGVDDILGANIADVFHISNFLPRFFLKSASKQQRTSAVASPPLNRNRRKSGASVRQTVPGKEATKVLPRVHVAISNAKALLKDMYHGIKEEFLQSYQDEFCYICNRMYFVDRTFARSVVAAIAYKPTFQHRPYNSSPIYG